MDITHVELLQMCKRPFCNNSKLIYFILLVLFVAAWLYSIVLNNELNRAFTVFKCETRTFLFLHFYIPTEVFPQKSKLKMFS